LTKAQRLRIDTELPLETEAGKILETENNEKDNRMEIDEELGLNSRKAGNFTLF
jgi:hypothetical protein